jgi:hypothetical protein
MVEKLKTYKLTVESQDGTPDKKMCIIYNNKAYSIDEAVNLNICSVEERMFTRIKNFTRTYLEITTRVADLVVIKPRNTGWGTDLYEICKYISYLEENFDKITFQEAKIAFAFLEPEAYAQTIAYENKLKSLL